MSSFLEPRSASPDVAQPFNAIEPRADENSQSENHSPRDFEPEALPVAESHSMGAPRGEEFDLSRLDERPIDEPKIDSTAPPWNRAWLVLAGVLAAYCFYFWVYGLGVRAQKPLPLGPIRSQSATVAQVRVHVAGAVARPGVYSLKADARVADALSKAGGALPGADPNALNLAGFIEDGAKISVPLKPAPAPKTTPTPVVIVREVRVPVAATSTETAPQTALAPSTNSSVGSSAPASSAPSTTTKKSDNLAFLRAHPIDLNRATSAQLQQLPGVGPKMAERILAYRSENGRFKSVSDLDNVKGFGEKKMETLKDLVVVK